MKQDICGYYFNEINDAHSHYNRNEYEGNALIIQQKLLKKYPKHSNVIKELFMHNQAFLLDSENNCLYLPNNYKLSFKGVIDIKNFNIVNLTGIGLNDVKTLYALNYLSQDTKNDFALSVTESISLSPEGEKLIDSIAEKLLTNMDKQCIL